MWVYRQYKACNQQFELILQHLWNKIQGFVQKIQQQRAAEYDRSVLQLELVFRNIHKAGKASIKDALQATRKTLRIYIFLPDFYFILAGITVMIFAAQIFVKPGVDYGFIRPVLFFVSAVVAGALPMLLAYITLPPHLLLKVNIWVVTLLNVTLSALIFAYVQPMIASTILADGVMDFEQLVWVMFVFYFFAEFYMLMRLHPIVCFKRYVERHTTDGIAQFIPAHKQGPLLSLSAQDHYVEIVTQKGAHLERMTVTKAIELVPKESGLQVHRSHWVAYRAILDLEKTGERYAVLLRNGNKLPVGKSKVQELQCYLKNR